MGYREARIVFRYLFLWINLIYCKFWALNDGEGSFESVFRFTGCDTISEKCDVAEGVDKEWIRNFFSLILMGR